MLKLRSAVTASISISPIFFISYFSILYIVNFALSKNVFLSKYNLHKFLLYTFSLLTSQSEIVVVSEQEP